MNQTTKPLHIIKLEASNIKRLKAVEIVPNGNTVTITGKNDQGKTSVLDAITYALGGKETICEQPIRRGASRAEVVVDLQDIVVMRKFTAAGGSTLTVKSKDGTPINSPQAVLDRLCSHVSFDPLSFTRMSPREQLDTLRRLVGLDFSTLDAEKKKAYDERTLVNRELATAKAKLASYPFDPSAPADEVSAASLMARMRDAEQHNQGNDQVKELWKQASYNLNIASQEVAAIEKEIFEIETLLVRKRNALTLAKKELTNKEDTLKEYEGHVGKLQYKDLEPIRQEMEQLDATNAKARANRRNKELRAEVTRLEDKVADLTNKIEDAEMAKREQLEKAKFPLPNLSFDESGVLLNGVPFNQGSQARQLQAAVAIGLALNPQVRVILIRDGSLLDDESMKLVCEMAEKNDAQVWIEVVNSKDPSAIVIEDGAIKD